MKENRHIRDNEERPVITFALFAYNQEQFIEEAIRGALSQTYSPLEVILSDDCSSDLTYEIMSRIANGYRGPHKIILNCNTSNLGICAHVNRLFEMASAEIVVIAAGDDISLPGRVEKSWRILKDNPDATCVTLGYEAINCDGLRIREVGPADSRLIRYSLEDLVAEKKVHALGASRALRKSVYCYFGPLSSEGVTEDTTMLLRCLLLGTVCCSWDTAVLYRIHSGNYSSPARMRLLNYECIGRQYVKDITLAVNRRVISQKTASSLRRILERRLRRSRLGAEYHMSSSKTLFALSRILFSRAYGCRMKLHYVLHALYKDLHAVLRGHHSC